MTRFISCFSVSLVACFCIFLEAESVQDRGFPGAVVFEAVFPHVVVGSIADIQYQSEIVIINSEDRKAQVELDFFFPSGESANDLLADGGADWKISFPWSRMENLQRSVENGRFYDEVAGHTVKRLEFPGRVTSLIGKELSCWARLRSNVSVSVFEKIRVVDGRGMQASADVTSSIAAVKQAELGTVNFKSPWYSGDPIFENAPQAGWHIGTSGFSLVNPRGTPAEIELELDAHKKTLSLGPHTKRDLMLGEISNSDQSGLLKARSLNGVPFAILGMGVRSWFDLNLAPTPKVNEPWLTFQPVWTHLSSEEAFNSSEEILTEAEMGGKSIVLTRFGFIRKDSQGKTDVHPLNVGSSQSEFGIAVDEAHGVAVIWGPGTEVAILFKSGDQVLYVLSVGGPASIAAVPDQPEKVEIRTGYLCYRTTIIVDTVKGEIVSVEHTRLPVGCPL